MSTKPAGAAAPKDKAVEAAEPVVWSTLQRDLERQGNPEAVLYMQYWVKAVPAGAAQPAGKFKRVPFKLHQRLSDYSARYNAESGEQLSWLFSALMQEPGRKMDVKTGTAIAKDVAKPPADAELAVAEYDDHDASPVFIARWIHKINGVPVERDFIQVLVNGNTKKAFALHRKWHAIDPKPTVR